MSQIDYDCPTCGKTYRFSLTNVGRTAKCRECGCKFKIEPDLHMRSEPYVSPVHRRPAEKVYVEYRPAKKPVPMTSRELERMSRSSNPTVNALSAIVNLFFSPFGYLIQGRAKEFVITFVIGFVLALLGLFLIIPWLGLPLLWLFTIIDCATYKGE